MNSKLILGTVQFGLDYGVNNTVGKPSKENIKSILDSAYSNMFHSFDDFNKHFEKYRKDLLTLKKDGIINNIGVSLYSNDELESVLKFNEITLVQLPFNLLDNNNKRGNIIKKAKEKGIEIHTRSAFLQGLFFKNTSEFTVKIKPLEPYLNLLNDLCDEDYKMNDLALNYVCNQKNIDKVLIGVDNVHQLESNILSEKKNIKKELTNNIEAIDVEETKLLNPSNW